MKDKNDFLGNFSEKTTFRLFSRPSFLGGAGRVLDVGATMSGYNENETDNETDSKALGSDWIAIGTDINYSINSYKHEQEEKQGRVCVAQ